jgi:hypothetical protein
MTAMNVIARPHACLDNDDRLIHKDGKRYSGEGIVADDLEGLMLYVMIPTMSLDVHRNQFRAVSTGMNRTATRP